MTKVISPKEREKQMEETRKKFFEESKFDPYNQRLGLFSFVGTTAISDDTYSKGKVPLRNEDGSVKTAPKNFLTTRGKRGKTPDCYFSSYEYIEDRYDSKKRNQSVKAKSEQIKKIHENPWKPDGPVKTVYSVYPSMPTMNFKQIKRKLPDGGVYTEPKNFLTSPPKKGEPNCTPGVLLGDYPHEPDPYDRKDQMAREQARKDKAKMQEQPFKSTVFGERPFFDDKTTYGGENPKPRDKRPATFNGVQHDKPFIPPNPIREGSTLSPFPEHMPDPYDPAKKKDKKEITPWKTTYREVTKPCVSVSSMIVNLRSEYPSLRHR